MCCVLTGDSSLGMCDIPSLPVTAPCAPLSPLLPWLQCPSFMERCHSGLLGFLVAGSPLAYQPVWSRLTTLILTSNLVWRPRGQQSHPPSS